jgi:hypothetical protein
MFVASSGPQPEALVDFSPERFAREHEARLQPAIWRGAAAGWPATRLWPDFEYLRRKLGDRMLTVDSYPDDDYRPGQRKGVSVSAAHFLDAVAGDNDQRLFLSEAPIFDGRPFGRAVLTELRDDIIIPPIVPADRQRQPAAMIFIGRSSSTPCHYHILGQSLACQVVGHKTFILMPPHAITHLQPYPWSDLARNNLSKLHFRRGALPEELTGQDLPFTIYVVRLAPGDMLFIPLRWWHAVFAEDLSVTVTYFWRSRLRQIAASRPPYLLRALPTVAAYAGWIKRPD